MPDRRPWKLRVSPTTSNRPVCSFASLSATSFASEPVLRRIERSSGAGTRPARRSASASTGSESIHELRCTTSSSDRLIASLIRGWLCPIVEQIWPDVKSRTRLPSAVSTQAPSARATTKGENPAAYRIRKRSRSSMSGSLAKLEQSLRVHGRGRLVLVLEVDEHVGPAGDDGPDPCRPFGERRLVVRRLAQPQVPERRVALERADERVTLEVDTGPALVPELERVAEPGVERVEEEPEQPFVAGTGRRELDEDRPEPVAHRAHPLAERRDPVHPPEVRDLPAHLHAEPEVVRHLRRP